MIIDLSIESVKKALISVTDDTWNGSVYSFSKHVILYTSPSFENPHKDKRTLDDILSGVKDDYSLYKTKLYFKLNIFGRSIILFDLFPAETFNYVITDEHAILVINEIKSAIESTKIELQTYKDI